MFDNYRRPDSSLTNYSKNEEFLNFLSHAFGVVFSAIFTVLLVNKFRYFQNGLFSMTVFGVSLLLMYSISATYHILKVGKLKRLFRKLDHCSIFLLIAGTYTPLCLTLVNNSDSNYVLSHVYCLAVIGIILNSINVDSFSKLSMFLYISMGWSIITIANSAFKFFNSSQIFWLFLGGIIYTIGAVIYVLGKKIPYMHFVWHIFVLFGSLCHIFIFFN